MRSIKTLAVLLAAVLFVAAPAAQAGSISTGDFADVSAWQLNVNASQDGNRIELTPNAGNQRGSAFHTSTMSFAGDYTFAAHFSYEMPTTGGGSDPDGQGADGMAFVIHKDDNGAGMLGAAGGAMGLSGGNNNGPFVAVGIDTWNGGAFDLGGNQNGNHYEIDSSLSGTSHAMSGPHTNNATPDTPPRFQGAGVIDVWVDYDGASDTMNVYESRTGGPKPGTPIVSGTVDLDSVFTSHNLYVGFTGGTGGATEKQDVLELQINSIVPPPPPPPPPAPTVNDFDTPGTPYVVSTGSGTAASVVTPTGGDDFLRLIHQQGGNRNYVGFDRTTEGTVDEIKADWDMRMFKNNTSGDQRFGDGYSIGLLNTGNFGTTGAPSGDTQPEKWQLANSLTVGFIGFDGSYGGKKDVEVYFNGAKQGATFNSPVDFTLDARSIGDPDENAPWTHAQLLVDFLPTGGANVSLYLAGTGAEGSGTMIFEDLFISTLDPYESRLGFAGRNGSAISHVDLDNINVQFGTAVIPEPITMGAIALALAGLGGYVRKRKQG